MPDLSVIVTTCNLEGYVEQCLDGIVNQTLTDLEIIVVDDGSTDATPELIAQYAVRDERIVAVFLPENSVGGVATAANAGLDRATAPYVGFADGDDLFEPDMFEKLLAAARANDADLAMCNYKLLDDETGELSDPADVGRWNDLDQPAYRLDIDSRRQFVKFVAVPWRKIYRREMIEANAIRFPVGDYFYEDNPFHWFSVMSAGSIAVVPEPLCFHRVARSGQTMATADERLFKIFEHHDTIRDWLEESDLLDDFDAALVAWVISQMEWIGARTPSALRRQLFEILRPIFDGYPRAVVERALVEGRKGQRARDLSRAVCHGSLGAFNRVLDQNTERSNPLVSAFYHLRYSGARRTAQITGRYVRMKLARSPLARTRLAGVGRNNRTVSNEDLLFALVVLEQRLGAVEEAVSAPTRAAHTED